MWNNVIQVSEFRRDLFVCCVERGLGVVVFGAMSGGGNPLVVFGEP